MDNCFDDVVRALAAGASRRRTLRLAVGGAIAGLLARAERGAAVGQAGRRCVRLGKRCERGDRCCAGRCTARRKSGKCRCPAGTVANKGTCIPRRPCTVDGDCGRGGKVCVDGVCKCTGDTIPNNGSCIARQPCSGGGDCMGGKVCAGGLCRCPPGWGDCEGYGVCGPMDSHPIYCGSCDRRCDSGEVCRDGTCVGE